MRSRISRRARPDRRRLRRLRRRLFRPGPFAAAPTLCALTIAGAACEPAASHEPFSLSDSAGVWIAQSTRPAWEASDAWVVEEEPSVVIGTVDGPPETLFSRIAAAWKQRDGRIVVGERFASEGMIRFYDEEGRFLYHVGRGGSGPGEFRLMLPFFPYRGDSIAAWDPFQSRLTVLDGEGRLGRTETIVLPTDESAAAGDGPMQVEVGSVVDAFSDGTFLTAPNRATPPDRSPRPLEHLHYRYSPNGDSLHRFEPTRDGTSAPVGSPFAPRAVRIAHGDRFYRGAGDVYEIRVQDEEGRLEGIIRASHRDLSLTEQDREAYRQDRRASVQEDADLPELEQELRGLDFPEALPPYAHLRIDSEGHAWVGHYPPIGEDVSRLWDVFDPDGRLLGTVETPDGFRLHQIGPDFVLGVYSGELGVPQVRVYPLSR